MAGDKRLIDANAMFDELIEKQYSEQTMGIIASYYPQMRAIVAKQPTVDAVETGGDPVLKKAMRMLAKEYEAAKRKDFVYDPIAYALFHTWKKVDEEHG